MKAAIFDMDGTVLNSTLMWRTVEQAFLLRLGIEPDERIFQKIDVMGFHGSIGWLIEAFGLPATAEELGRLCDQMVLDAYRQEVAPKAGIAALLQALHSRGIPTALATLTAHRLADVVLQAHRLYGLFDHVLTVEDVNGVKKDRPDLFLKAAGLMKTAPRDTVVFEDSLYAMKTARSAGFEVWAIEDPAAAGDRAEIMRVAHRYLKSWPDLLDEYQAGRSAF